MSQQMSFFHIRRWLILIYNSKKEQAVNHWWYGVRVVLPRHYAYFPSIISWITYYWTGIAQYVRCQGWSYWLAFVSLKKVPFGNIFMIPNARALVQEQCQLFSFFFFFTKMLYVIKTLPRVLKGCNFSLCKGRQMTDRQAIVGIF